MALDWHSCSYMGDLVVGPVRGFRFWYARWYEGQAVLQSVYHPTLWPHDRPLQATCEKPWSPIAALRHFLTGARPARHAPPCMDCRCGIYAMSTPSLDAERELALGFGMPVAGVVQLWGKVVQHEHGFRAEFTRPLELVHGPTVCRSREERRLLQALLERYHLPMLPHVT